MRSRVSVIVPSHNCARYVGEALDSIVAQNYPDLEIIVVDDGSTDGTPEVVAAHPGPIKLIRQANQGPAAARNEGLRHATGELIAFLDADDVWLPGKLDAQVDFMAKHPEVAICYTDFSLWHPQNGVYPPAHEFIDQLAPDAVDPTLSGWIYPDIWLDCPIAMIVPILRREVFERVGPFDTTLTTGSDLDFWLRASQHFAMTKLTKRFALYRIHEASITFRPLQQNNGYLILSRALERYGYAAPDGKPLPRDLARARLARVSFNFGSLHLRKGNPALAYRAFAQTARHRPFWIRNRVMQLIAASRCLTHR